MYDDDKGNPVPATPKEAKKDKVDGERTDKKVIIKKKDGSEKVSDMKEEPKADDKKSLADKVKGAKEKANGEKKAKLYNPSDEENERMKGYYKNKEEAEKKKTAEDYKKEERAKQKHAEISARVDKEQAERKAKYDAMSPEEKAEYDKKTEEARNKLISDVEKRRADKKAQEDAMSPEEKADYQRRREESKNNFNQHQQNMKDIKAKTLAGKGEEPKQPEGDDDKKDLKDKVKNAKEKTPEEKALIRQRLRAEREKEAQQKFLERQKENNKGGHEKSEEEIKANNEKIRKERNLPDEETENVKKQEETVSSAWRKDFINKANKGDTKDLPDRVKNLMGKYKDYWKRVNQKDHSMTDEERAEGDRLEAELKATVREYPNAFGKKTTVKDGDKTEVKPGAPKKLNLSSLLKSKKAQAEEDDEEGPSDAELKAIEREQKKSKK